MSSSSWWANKMGQQAPAADRPPVSPRPAPALPPYPQPTVQSAPNIAVTQDNIQEAAMLWQGGEASRTETRLCPNCGSDHYFSRANSGRQVPARCYDCGYTDGRPMQGMPT